MDPSTRLRPVLGLLVASGALALAPGVATASTPEYHPNVIGGTPAAVGEWPSIAALIVSSKANAADGQFCGGTLVASRWVLTAAHCVIEDNGSTVPASSIDVAVGPLKLSEVSGAQRIAVSSVVVNPGYSPSAFGNDVALLKLSRDSTQPTMAIIPPGDDSLVAAGRPAKVAGWGCSEPPAGNPPECPATGFPDQLQQASITVQANLSCTLAYGATFNGNEMICAGLGSPNACFGDSGGPLTIIGSAGEPVLVGDVSFGDEHCAGAADRGVYGRLSTYRSWIAGILAIGIPSAPTVSLERGPLQGQLTVRWTTPAGDGGSAITGYRISAAPALAGTPVTAAPTARSYTFSNLNLATRYAFEVRAENSAGESRAAPTAASLPGIDAPARFWRPSAGRLPGSLKRGVRESVRCSRSCTARLSLRLSEETAARYGFGARTTIGSTTSRLRAGQKKKLVAKFTSTARRKLRRVRTLRLTAVSSAASSGYLRREKIWSVTLRR